MLIKCNFVYYEIIQKYKQLFSLQKTQHNTFQSDLLFKKVILSLLIKWKYEFYVYAYKWFLFASS